MIEIRNLTKSFDGNIVLDNLSLEIKDKESLVIIGRSGCGKSVLLKHIIGLLFPDSGEIIVDSIKVNEKNVDEIRKKFGMVFQSSALFDSLTVEENVGFVLNRYSLLPKEEIKRIVYEKLKLVGLEKVEKMMPASLSGGMKKRVAIARAIVTNPSIILYDEPTTGLDPITADAINNLIIELKEKLNTTQVIVTHDIKSAFKIADRIAMLYKGKIIAIGTKEEMQNCNIPEVQQFLKGSSQGPISVYE
jgi:phospholipid/cholesterol/gamma-HCH transport system ATP-binding protein